jgi:hypothetical protein
MFVELALYDRDRITPIRKVAMQTFEDLWAMVGDTKTECEEAWLD